MREDARQPEDARDPKTGHPIGTGVGAAAGAAAGAVAGTAAAGPVGTIVGGAVGAIAGGLAGKGVAELIDPVEEESYWRGAYKTEPYYRQGTDFERYENAYRVGYMGRAKYDGRSYHEIEDELVADYSQFKGNDMAWEEARPAARAAWDRADRRIRTATGN